MFSIALSKCRWMGLLCAAAWSLAAAPELAAQGGVSSETAPIPSHAAPTVPQEWSVTPLQGTDTALIDQAFGPDGSAGMSWPASEWRNKEMVLYRSLLAAAKFDVLVVPVQVMGSAFGHSSRAAMSGALSAAIGRALDRPMPDPTLVAKALGYGLRRVRDEDVYALADAIGARQVIWTYAGHDRGPSFQLAFKSQSHDGGARAGAAWPGPALIRQIRGLRFDDHRTPLDAFERALPLIVSQTVGSATRSESPTSTSRLDLTALPPRPLDLLHGLVNPARSAYAFLVLHALAPAAAESTKGLFAAKAYLASGLLSPEAPEYRALRARSLHALGYRIAAIDAIGSPATDEERALMATLNGDLPTLRRLATQEPNGLKRLLQQLDVHALSVGYGIQDARQARALLSSLRVPGSVWPALATRALLEFDGWSRYDNTALKALLEQELPLPGAGLTLPAAGPAAPLASLLGRTSIDLSVREHGRNFINGVSSPDCCRSEQPGPNRFDYLELLMAIGDDNLIRQIEFLSLYQGNSEQALQYAIGIEPVYRGHSLYTVRRAEAERALAERSTGARREGLLRSAYEGFMRAAFWEQGQSAASSIALSKGGYLAGVNAGYPGNLYHTDRPFQPLYWTWAEGGATAVVEGNHVAALKNATWQFEAFYGLADTYRRVLEDPAREAELAQLLQARFLGSPGRNRYLADAALRQGDTRTAMNLLNLNLKELPSHWDSRIKLGELMLADGQVAEAARLMREHPGFRKDSEANRVELSNQAFAAASLLFWSGNPEASKPLFEVAVSQGTGSYAEMRSSMRLRLLDGDLAGALDDALLSAQRYRDGFAYRDLLGMMHASGFGAQAWEAFAAVERAGDDPMVWETVLVGHHVAGMSEARVVDWVQAFKARRARSGRGTAATYLLRFATTDRTPTVGLAATLDQLDLPVWQLQDERRLVVRPWADGITADIVGPAAGDGRMTLPLGAFRATPKLPVRSDLSFFAEAYRAIKTGDFAGARRTFEASARLHDPKAQAIYMLPYHAFAAAKSGDTAAVERLLSEIPIEDRRFDYHLAKAVLAVSAKPSEVVAQLQSARYRRPFTEDRPLLTQYTFGEIVEWLAGMTGDVSIRRLGAQWARASGKVEPWQSWPYALLARLSDDRQEVTRALAMLKYLDPESERLSKVSRADVEAARKAHAGSNPFLRGARKEPPKRL